MLHMAVIDTLIQKESQDRYLTYALSVVSGRALPDVRDGLKPVQRRILYAMAQNLGLSPDKSHRKSAAVVGEVLAKFHPHGDIACYDAMVRMAQDFSLRYPLVDGQGNFGSLDGDNAAAYRYTEVKLKPIAIEVIGEIEEETVSFRDNFDATVVEPVVFPSRIPNLLINGASGIAVGMATSIPPHNLKDTIKALLELSSDPELSNAKLAGIIKGPDFPTGCLILNTRREISSMYESGKGSIRMRAEWATEEGSRGKQFIVITAIPYAVNKSQLVEKIADLILEKKVPQLSDVRDESTDKVRVVLELTSGADAEVAMAYLFKHTSLESSFPVNLTAIVPVEDSLSVKPVLLSLKECMQHFLDFRHEVWRKKLVFEKKKLLERLHILEGFALILDKLDEAIKIVRKSEGRSDAAEKLRARFKLSEIQSFAVVDMRIYQLSKTSVEEIEKELAEKSARVKEIEKILKSPAKLTELVRKDLEHIGETFGDKRLCRIVTDEVEMEFDESQYVVHEDVFAIVTADGWIKRIRQNNEVDATRIREGDSITRAHPLSTLDSVAFFTNLGNLYALKVADFPSSSGYGDPIQKVLKFKDGEQIVESFGVKSSASKPSSYNHVIKESDLLVLVTKNGVGFTLKIEGLDSVKRNGKRAIKPREGDSLAAVCPISKNIAFITHSAYGLVIESKEIPVRESAAVGVSLIGVRKEDRLIAAVGFERNVSLTLTLENDNQKEVEASEIVKGHRALKGNKVISRGEIKKVETTKKQGVIPLTKALD